MSSFPLDFHNKGSIGVVGLGQKLWLTRARPAGSTWYKAGASGPGNQVEKIMNNQKIGEAGAGNGSKSKASVNARKIATKSGEAGALKAGSAKNSARVSTARQAGKSKKDQLITLLSKPNGARVSVIVEKLGWQAHTVRAALSGLRKQDFEITTSKSPRTGETVYTILPRSETDASVSGEVRA